MGTDCLNLSGRTKNHIFALHYVNIQTIRMDVIKTTDNDNDDDDGNDDVDFDDDYSDNEDHK